METARFERLVRQVVQELPSEILERMENFDIFVEDWASQDHLIGSGIEDKERLLGLYVGIPLTERYYYNFVEPDKIIIFKKAIENICDTDEEIVAQVHETIRHEIAHHFGMDDQHLHEIGRY